MANKKINQLDTRTGAALTDLSLVGDPTSGTSFKLTLQQISTLMGVPGKFNQPTGTTAQYLRGDGSIATFPTIPSGTVTSVGLTMPSAFVVANSPVTSSGTLAVTGAGTTSQYVRGDGSLETFPTLTGFVPYSGATGDVNLGEFQLRAGQLTLDTSPTGTAAVGTTRWNDTIGSSETTLKGGSVILKNGVDLVARVVNKVTPNTTLTKAAYQAVRVSGAQGQRLAVAFAQANNDANSADTIGLVTETIATNQEGFIITVGQLENINTTGSLQGETWVDGDVLYLSPFTPGAITKVKPTGNGHIVVIGYVEYAHANNGKIYVKVMNGWELDELHNVDIVTPANNEALVYESSTQLWKNKTIATALGYTPVPTTRTLTINGTAFDLSADRSWTIAGMAIGNAITSATAGSVLFAGTSGVLAQNNANLFWDNTNARLGIGTNAPAVGLDIRGSLEIARFGTTGSDNYINIKNSVGNFYLGRYANACYVWSTDTLPIDFYTNNIVRARIFGASGNLVLQNGGTFTDGGQRLQVYGDAFVRGSGATSATNALAIQNSAGGEILKVRNDSIVVYGGANTGIFCSTDKGQTITNGAGGLYLGYFATGDLAYVDVPSVTIGRPNNRLLNATSGTQIMGSVVGNFSPTSGTGLFRAFEVVPTINQTGGANGITRGLYVNPTLTSAADWRSIEWSNNSGWGLYGAGTAPNFLGGNLTVSRNQDNFTLVELYNTTSGTNSAVSFSLNSDTSSGAGGIGKYSTLKTAYKIIASKDLYFSNNIIGGDIAILNDFTTGKIKFASGGSSTAQMTLTAAGRLLLGTTTEGTFLLDVNGTARVGGLLTASSGVFSQGRITATQLSSDSGGVYYTRAFGHFTTPALLIQTSTGGNASTDLSMCSFSDSNGFGDIATRTGNYLSITSERNPGSSEVGFTGTINFINLTTDAGGSKLTNSSTGRYNAINIGYRINRTGAGIMRGFYYNPIVDNLGGSVHNAIETTSGNIIFNNSNCVVNSSSINASAVLQADSTTKGFLPPRMTTTQKNAIATPAAGLQVYDTTLNQMSYYNGTTWVNF